MLSSHTESNRLATNIFLDQIFNLKYEEQHFDIEPSDAQTFAKWCKGECRYDHKYKGRKDDVNDKKTKKRTWRKQMSKLLLIFWNPFLFLDV